MILLAFLFPVAVYCLILALVNRGPHPVLLSGTWDFLGVLFASSGFLLLGGPAALSGLYERRRLAWALGQPTLPGLGEEHYAFWAGLWILYYALLVGGALVLLRQRRWTTSIYNIDTGSFDLLLADVLNRLGLAWSRTASGVALTGRPDGAVAVVDVDAFAPLRHVTLHWQPGSERLRAEVETELTRTLAEVETGYNPVGTWLLSVSACLFLITLFGMLLFLTGLIVRILR